MSAAKDGRMAAIALLLDTGLGSELPLYVRLRRALREGVDCGLLLRVQRASGRRRHA